MNEYAISLNEYGTKIKIKQTNSYPFKINIEMPLYIPDWANTFYFNVILTMLSNMNDNVVIDVI